MANFIDGQILTADDLNSALNSTKILELYTGSGFNQSAGSQGSTSSYEFTAVPSTSIYGADYIKISPTCKYDMGIASSYSGDIYLTIDIKEIGGSYSNLFSQLMYETNDEADHSRTYLAEFYHTLTAGEKANGFQVRITSTVNVSAGGGSGSITNVNTTLKLEV